MKSTQHQYQFQDLWKSSQIEDESIHMVVTSPPRPMSSVGDAFYNTGESGKTSYNMIHEHLEEVWKECIRVVKPGGFICINIADIGRTVDDTFQLYSNHSRITESFDRLGCDVLPSITWRTPSKMPAQFMGSGVLPGGAYVRLEHEWILIFRKPGKRSYRSKEGRGQSSIFWSERNDWYSDQWKDIPTKQILNLPKGYQDPIPMDISLRLILMHTIYGDTILDPFGQWGKTSFAAMLTGRNSISIMHDQKLLDHALSVPTKRGTKDILNGVLTARILDHLKFVEKKDLLFFRYKNEKHGFPVKTQQERQLALYPIKSVSKSDEVVNVNYRNLKTIEMEELMNQARS